jgi:hypothetical protein
MRLHSLPLYGRSAVRHDVRLTIIVDKHNAYSGSGDVLQMSDSVLKRRREEVVPVASSRRAGWRFRGLA